MDEKQKAAIDEGMEKIIGEEPSLAAELIKERSEALKREAATSECTIKRLWAIILALVAAIIAQYAINTYERMQYDYVSSYEATGAYAIIDSSGTVIGGDYSADEIQKMLEAALEVSKAKGNS